MFKVCIADDEKYVLESIQHRVLQCGLDIEIAGTAQNGMEAYELYEKEKPDIFFVDISMPVCGGLEFVERVRRLDKESTTKFIIVSGYDDFEYMKKAIKNGVVNYIMKPVNQQELYETLEEICRTLQEKRDKEQDSDRNWRFLQEYTEREEVFHGTLLLIFGNNIVRNMKDCVDNADERRLLRKLGEIGKYLRFHETDNMFLVMIPEKFLSEQEIYCLWEEIRRLQEIYLVYKKGKNLSVQQMIDEMEITLNGRFWQGSMHVLMSKPIVKADEADLSGLERAIENTREEEWKKEITGLGKGIFDKKENVSVLKEFYQSVLILVANKYRQHNYEIPEILKEELYPYSLERCMNRQEIQKKMYEFTRLIHEKILQESQKNELVEQVIEYLEYHYAEEMNLNDIANEFFVAPNYLYKKFKEKKDMTVMQYLENIRMHKAEELLRNTNISVTAVAGMTGYNDSNYFARIFKKNYGLSPREFRNSK